MIDWKKVWGGFREIYGPALVGGIFLSIADLMQSDRQGQIFKVGGMIKRSTAIPTAPRPQSFL
jgi:hypothetical protein